MGNPCQPVVTSEVSHSFNLSSRFDASARDQRTTAGRGMVFGVLGTGRCGGKAVHSWVKPEVNPPKGSALSVGRGGTVFSEEVSLGE